MRNNSWRAARGTELLKAQLPTAPFCHSPPAMWPPSIHSTICIRVAARQNIQLSFSFFILHSSSAKHSCGLLCSRRISSSALGACCLLIRKPLDLHTHVSLPTQSIFNYASAAIRASIRESKRAIQAECLPRRCSW